MFKTIFNTVSNGHSCLHLGKSIWLFNFFSFFLWTRISSLIVWIFKNTRFGWILFNLIDRKTFIATFIFGLHWFHFRYWNSPIHLFLQIFRLNNYWALISNFVILFVRCFCSDTFSFHAWSTVDEKLVLRSLCILGFLNFTNGLLSWWSVLSKWSCIIFFILFFSINLDRNFGFSFDNLCLNWYSFLGFLLSWQLWLLISLRLDILEIILVITVSFRIVSSIFDWSIIHQWRIRNSCGFVINILRFV